jgi:hypothetical protein
MRYLAAVEILPPFGDTKTQGEESAGRDWSASMSMGSSAGQMG